MEKKILEQHIVMLLLLNESKPFERAYSLIKVLSRWFDIINYSEIFDEMIAEGLLQREYINQEGHYSLTDKAKLSFQNNEITFVESVNKSYPNQKEVIETLLGNVPK